MFALRAALDPRDDFPADEIEGRLEAETPAPIITNTVTKQIEARTKTRRGRLAERGFIAPEALTEAIAENGENRPDSAKGQ